MTTHAQSRSSTQPKTKATDPRPSQDKSGSERAACIQLSSAATTLGEMRRAGLRYWLFWHTSAVHMLSRQLEMLTAGAAEADVSLAQPKQRSRPTAA
jgi:hypothetical protein